MWFHESCESFNTCSSEGEIACVEHGIANAEGFTHD